MCKLEIRLARIITIAFITIVNFGYVLAQLPPPSDQSSGQFSPEIGFKVGGAMRSATSRRLTP